jgi:hypothetical protein
MDIEEEIRRFRHEVIWPAHRMSLEGERMKTEGAQLQTEAKLLLLRKIQECLIALEHLESPEKTLEILGDVSISRCDAVEELLTRSAFLT